MKNSELISILRAYKDGEISETEAASKIDSASILKLAHTSLDTARERRCGNGEIIYGAGKTPKQILDIAKAISLKGGNVLCTRISPESAELLLKEISNAEYSAVARAVRVINSPIAQSKKTIAIITAGTSDMPVAEEARFTAEFLGCKVAMFYDCGVAGIHRIASEIDEIRRCSAVVAIAGMEGALASVVAGLVSVPVFAVPTSVGYGASYGGLTALLAMINSCANGVSVVNIDNGFGAAYCACLCCKSSE